jgi:N-acetylglucosamine-6-phosphate deacetylase
MHQIEDAITAGAEFVTHLGNGLPAVLPRHDNALQRLLSWDELTVFLIPDGHHLPPFVLKNIFRAKAFGKALFTTDCMAAAGAPPGDHVVAGIHVHVGEDRVVRDPRTGLFAGSALTMPEAAQNIHAWLGLGEEQAALLCGDLVADALGIPF